jgi:predicted negative regulator of RcsB-dependent stress response
MVDELLSDREREEALRIWWRDNWRWILSGVVLGFALLFGWRWWQAHEIQRANAAADTYQALILALDGGDREAANAREAELEEAYRNTPYFDQGRLARARAMVAERDYEAAAARLRGVADTSDDPELGEVARLRLARVLIEQGKHDDALALLVPETLGAFGALAHALRGDVFVAKNDAAAARREYEAALAGPADEPTIDRATVELKLEALGPAPTDAAEDPS